MKNILTVDVEDWQQSTLDHTLPITDRVCRSTETLLNIFAKRKIKGTFFILGIVAEKFPELVTSICKEGHEIASHGYSHRLIFTQTKDEFRLDIKRSMEILSGITGERIFGYRAPDFSITRRSSWALDILLEEGIKFDSSIFPIRHPRYGIPNSLNVPYIIRSNGVNQLVEMPLSSFNIGKFHLPFAGGGYMRLYPYKITRYLIKKLNKQGRPIVTYFHPYEIDLNEFQNINFKIPVKLKVTQGLNRGKMKERIEALLKDFEFIPVNVYLQSHKPVEII